MRTVSSRTLERDYTHRYNLAPRQVVLQSINTSFLILIPYVLSQSLGYIFMALGFWYGSVLISSGEYITEQFFNIFIAAISAGQAAGQLSPFTSSLS